MVPGIGQEARLYEDDGYYWQGTITTVTRAYVDVIFDNGPMRLPSTSFEPMFPELLNSSFDMDEIARVKTDGWEFCPPKPIDFGKDQEGVSPNPEWLTIAQAASVQGCSTDLIRDMITGGQFGKAGTVRDNLPLRDLNPQGAHRRYRLHRSRFTKENSAPSPDSHLVKAPSFRINTKAPKGHQDDDFLGSFDKWSDEFEKKSRRGRG